MWTRQHKKRNTGRLILPVICAAVIAYFGFHAYHGEFGIYSEYRFEARAAELQSRFDQVHDQRLQLERRVQLLHDGTLEKDMLDEQARRGLNVSKANELTVMLRADNMD